MHRADRRVDFVDRNARREVELVDVAVGRRHEDLIVAQDDGSSGHGLRDLLSDRKFVEGARLNLHRGDVDEIIAKL